MLPGAFPMLPATVFPIQLVPSLSAVTTGLSAVDVTAAVAALVWAFGGLVALRIAILMSRGPDAKSDSESKPNPPSDHRDGFRNAA
ncbi:MAG TPA: hypothetical protein VMS22_10390 [Candidatus Eisenbacteria bacterium]|nr:hypothetical protein [Candidatus Eisenbacteria bacterium]